MKKIWLLCGVLSVCGGSVWADPTKGLTDENNGSVATRSPVATPATINVTNPLFEGKLGNGQDFMAFGAHMRGRLEAFEEEKETEKAAGVARQKVSMPLTYSEYWTYLGGAKRALEKKVADVGVGTQDMYDLLQTITNTSKNKDVRTLEKALDLQVQTWEVFCDSEGPAEGRVKACDERAQSNAALTDAPDAVQHKLAFAYDKGLIPMLFFGEALFDLKALGRTWQHGCLALSAANPVDDQGNPIPVHGETVSRKGHFYHDLFHMNNTVAYPNTLNKEHVTLLWKMAEVEPSLVPILFIFVHEFPDILEYTSISRLFCPGITVQDLTKLIQEIIQTVFSGMNTHPPIFTQDEKNKRLFHKQVCDFYNLAQTFLASFLPDCKAKPFDLDNKDKSSQELQEEWKKNANLLYDVTNLHTESLLSLQQKLQQALDDALKQE